MSSDGARQESRDLAHAVDWSAVREESLDLLRKYLRFPTVNDPERLSLEERAEHPWTAGGESEAAEWLGAVLAGEGVPFELLTSAPGRTSVVARLPGNGVDRSLTLLSHSDVVPATRSEWERGIDPFGAMVRDGYVYGRGALDLKGLGIAQAMVFLLLRRLRLPLRRDLVLVIAADEEAGGRFGSAWLKQERPELFDTAAVLGEGAYSLRDPLGAPGVIQAIAFAEKGCLELELVVETPSHHVSMPGSKTAPERLIHALHRVQRMTHANRITPPTRALLRQLASTSAHLPRPLRKLPRLAAWLVARHLGRGALLGSMLRDTVVVTVLESGSKHNVVPARARAVLGIRYLPGTDPIQLTARIRDAVNDPLVTVREIHHKPTTLSDLDAPEYRVLEKLAGEGEDGVRVAPILSPGASDCRYWRHDGVNCFGWVPFVIPAADVHGVHGPNERVSLAEFARGIERLFLVVATLSTSAPVAAAGTAYQHGGNPAEE